MDSLIRMTLSMNGVGRHSGAHFWRAYRLFRRKPEPAERGHAVAGFREYRTFHLWKNRNGEGKLNSGNVAFSNNEEDTEELTKQIAIMIKNKFNLDIPVFVISKENLENILYHAPDWWGNENKEIYDNLIFLIPPATFAEVFNEIGEPRAELEKIKDYKEAIFWSFSRKD